MKEGMIYCWEPRTQRSAHAYMLQDGKESVTVLAKKLP